MYVRPHIGALPVADIDTRQVLLVLQPLWSTRPETGSRVRNRIELILDYAHAHGFRAEENPARWRLLSKILPRPSKLRTIKPHPALAWRDAPAFMADLHKREATSTSQCLEFLILTAARLGEALRMKWGEIDFQSKTWTVPASRMKAGRLHRVALSPAAMALLAILPRLNDDDYVFPGTKRLHLSQMALKSLLVRMGRTDISIHGMRACFATWAREQTLFQREVIEAALAHAVGDAAERAYARGDALEKRRMLMSAWAEYLERGSTAAEVVPLRA
jgi:integrase